MIFVPGPPIAAAVVNESFSFAGAQPAETNGENARLPRSGGGRGEGRGGKNGESREKRNGPRVNFCNSDVVDVAATRREPTRRGPFCRPEREHERRGNATFSPCPLFFSGVYFLISEPPTDQAPLVKRC